MSQGNIVTLSEGYSSNALCELLKLGTKAIKHEPIVKEVF
jgi:hypothetical protein